MCRETTQRMHLRINGNSLVHQLDRGRAIDDRPAQCAAGLEARNDQMAFLAPEVVLEVMQDAPAGAHATAGNDDKCEYSKNIGAHHVVNHNQDNWINEVKNITGKRGVDVVFEHIGSATWEQSQRILSKGGRIVTCGATTGYDVNINLAHLFMKQHTILGSTMASIPAFKEVMDKIENGKYIPMVDKVIPMEDIRDAHEFIENRMQMGKVVLVH